jgi:hypothetical protein
MNDLPPAVVNDLIALGSLEDSPSDKRDQLLARLKPFERVNRLGRDRWNEVADRLSEVELGNLVRGLTAAELELHWCGGSVAGVIWVYRHYETRFPDRAEELADWVLARSENPYVPFGRMRAGARSVAEYRSYVNLVRNTERAFARQKHPNACDTMKALAQAQRWDTVVWTALPSNFQEVANRPFSVEATIRHLNGLGEPAKSHALEYLSRALEEVITPVRRAAIQAGLIPPPQPAQP